MEFGKTEVFSGKNVLSERVGFLIKILLVNLMAAGYRGLHDFGL